MMYNFESVELKHENGELQIVLHMKVPKNSTNTEFGAEFNFNKDDSLRHNAVNFVKKKFPKLKVASIVVVAGTLLLTTIPMQKAEAHEADFNMSYLYFGNTSSYISQVDKTQGNLNLVSPSYFDLNADGSLKLTSQFDSKFVNEMHNRGIKVVPFLSNHWDRTLGRAALANREALSTQIANAIIKNNLDGVQVDIENTTDVDRDAYTDLVRLLREKLPADKEVSVAVAANPNGWTKGWHGTYNYKELAKYASYLMIMAYDESYEGGPEGPVASIGFVDRSIQYALKQGVPADKVVLGVPFYGRFWKEGAPASEGGKGISNTKVDEMLVKYGGNVVFDEASKSPKATITIKSGDPTTTIAGKTLAPGTYHIWYENNDSIREKLRLIHKYEIKGTGSWSLGQENTSMWQYYKTWMSHEGVEVIPVNPDQPKEQTGEISPTQITYTVKSGDSLWKIATAHKLTVDELKVLNGLTSDAINIGQVLKVSNAVLTPTTAPVVEAPTIQTTTYTVKSGDSLWKVATDHNMAVTELKTLNGLTSDVINIGQVLKVKSSVTSTTSNITQTVSQPKANTPGAISAPAQEAVAPKPVGKPAPAPAKTTTVAAKSTTPAKTTTAVKSYTVLKAGSKGTAVTTLQNKLIKAGSYSGKATGTYDTKTKSAVVAFQKKYKLAADGIAGPATQSKLDTVIATATSTKATTSTKAVAKSYPVLKVGSKGTAVVNMQSKLIKARIYKGKATGTYDTATKNAVIAFQKKYKLAADGIAGPATQSKLDTVIATATSTKATTSTKAVAKSYPVLKVGSKGTAVTNLQNKLIKVGSYTGKATGTYDTKTKSAVVAFQKKYKLAADGIAGPATLGKMDSVIK
ncbi:peptidoglycan-binding protein [Ureibacillus chungkukjangi]|uniref:peptidoglycan-binding protein n=1 Tax=Ureibacillus chungkukjangi TaxID=1202712 RepID=UPI00203F3F47|nr:peptidoglycan-binding protein [Ureibacillus chungkukjangi]MCM3387015.1 peptidoglycan-binding protein [Ureibacillus chungkukjangi]